MFWSYVCAWCQKRALDPLELGYVWVLATMLVLLIRTSDQGQQMFPWFAELFLQHLVCFETVLLFS